MTSPVPVAPVLRPSPLDLGSVVGGAIAVVRRRLGQFVLLALIQGVVTALLVLIAIGVLVFGIFQAVERQSFSALIIVGVVAFIAAIVASMLIQIKTYAMMTLGAHDTIQGGQPTTLGDLFARTAGVVGRVLLLVLALMAVVTVIYGVIAGIGFAIFMGAARSGDSGSIVTAIVSFYLIVMLLMLVLGVVAFYIQVRLLYLVPALAIENRSAVDSLKRSWALTKGNVLRTLGYYLIAVLLVSAVSAVAQIIPQMLAMPASFQQSSENPSPAVFLAMVPAMVAALVLQVAVQLLATPFQASYITVMYVDQVRRNELPAGFGAAPGPGSYQPGSYQPGPYQPGPYQPGPNQAGPYQPGPNQAGPYQPGSNQTGPHQPGPQQGWGQPPGQWGN